MAPPSDENVNIANRAKTSPALVRDDPVRRPPVVSVEKPAAKDSSEEKNGATNTVTISERIVELSARMTELYAQADDLHVEIAALNRLRQRVGGDALISLDDTADSQSAPTTTPYERQQFDVRDHRGSNIQLGRTGDLLHSQKGGSGMVRHELSDEKRDMEQKRLTKKMNQQIQVGNRAGFDEENVAPIAEALPQPTNLITQQTRNKPGQSFTCIMVGCSDTFNEMDDFIRHLNRECKLASSPKEEAECHCGVKFEVKEFHTRPVKKRIMEHFRANACSYVQEHHSTWTVRTRKKNLFANGAIETHVAAAEGNRHGDRFVCDECGYSYALRKKLNEHWKKSKSCKKSAAYDPEARRGKRRPSEGAEAVALDEEAPSGPKRRRIDWTPEEDKALIAGITKWGYGNWAGIRQEYPILLIQKRTSHALRDHWRKTLQKRPEVQHVVKKYGRMS